MRCLTVMLMVLNDAMLKDQLSYAPILLWPWEGGVLLFSPYSRQHIAPFAIPFRTSEQPERACKKGELGFFKPVDRCGVYRRRRGGTQVTWVGGNFS